MGKITLKKVENEYKKWIEKNWTIGELAEKTGITIRTLHHYHDKGLLIPSAMTDAGHRIYSENDIIRLQQIISLKGFGFNLETIKSILKRKDFDPLEIIQTQLRIVKEQIKTQEKIKSQLETMLIILPHKEANVEDFIKLIGVLNMDKITLEIGLNLVSFVDKEKGAELLEGINNLRKTISFPPVHILDNLILNENEYRILLSGTEIFRGQCKSAVNFSQENINIIVNKLKEVIENHAEELD
jgi:DNA-binding transcriptional MerR regulator